VLGNVIQISTTPARIDISTVRPLYDYIHINSQLDIEKTQARLDISSRDIKCDIDSTNCRAEEGLKTTSQLTADYARAGIENAQNVAHEASVEGQEIIHAGPHERAQQEIDKEKVINGQQKEYGLAFIPSQGPQITWEKNEIYMNYQPEQYMYHWNVSTKPDTQMVRSGSVSITMTQQPSITFLYTGDTNTLNSLDQQA
jgi:hypothetical protein